MTMYRSRHLARLRANREAEAHRDGVNVTSINDMRRWSHERGQRLAREFRAACEQVRATP
jgi:hypothetical protein